VWLSVAHPAGQSDHARGLAYAYPQLAKHKQEKNKAVVTIDVFSGVKMIKNALAHVRQGTV